MLVILSLTFSYIYKKLRYREEHSTSIMLSWCTLTFFSGESVGG